MRSTLCVLFLLIGISHGLFGPVNQLLNNVGNTIQSTANQIGQTAVHFTSQIENTVSQLTNTINEIQTSANTLWGQVFSPAFDLLMKDGQLIFNEQLNTLSSAISRPTIESPNFLSVKFIQLIAGLKSNVRQFYDSLFAIQQQALIGLQQGERYFEERVRLLNDKLNEIKKQIDQWTGDIKNELESYANTLQGNWTQKLYQYKQNIDVGMKTLAAMLRQLVENLIKNLLKTALALLPNAMATIEKLKAQGLLSFSF